MLVTSKDGAEVEITIYGADADDIQITSAEFVDRDRNVTEEECTWILENHAERIYEEWLNDRISAAEYAAEGLER